MNDLSKIGNNFLIKKENEKFKIEKRTLRKKFKKGNGITLIALVVTIVVLLILAGITINYIFSEGGLFDTAKNSGNTWQDAQNSDINAIKDVNGMIGNLANSTESGGTITPTEPDTPTTDEPTEVVAESVTMSQTTATVYMGETLTLTATVLPENTSNKTVTWKSSNEEVARIDEFGVITPVSAGETIITAKTADGSDKTEACTVTVTYQSVADTSLKIIDTSKNREVADEYGNKIVIPKAFKIAEDSGSTVPEGIVIEDGTSTDTTTGNQFVWIPVGTVYMNEAKTVTKQVQLGRYTFDSTGTPNLEQAAFNVDGTANYETEIGIRHSEWDYWGYPADAITKELTTERPGVASDGTDGKNATAKDLAGFLESAKNNGGYYIARYEASYGSGFDISKNTETETNKYSLACYANAKPVSKKSTSKSFDTSTEDSLTEGSLWNYITQLAASKVSRNMYEGKLDAKGNSVGVESDLMNSYAFDTAIVYIRQMKEEYANLANYNCTSVGSKTSHDNTGSNSGDKFCNIYDMVANCREWTTECYTKSSSSSTNHCVYRNSKCNNPDMYMASRLQRSATYSFNSIVFRPICYIKSYD